MKNKIFDIYLKVLISIFTFFRILEWSKKIDHKKLIGRDSVIIKEARRRNWPIESLKRKGRDTGIFRVKINGKFILFDRIPLGHSYQKITDEEASNKWIAKKLLQRENIPTPRGELIEDLKEALEFIKQFGFPVVIKPLKESKCIGVTTDINDKNELEEAICYAKKYGQQILIEEFLEGRNYRLTVIDGKVEAACQRIHPYVIGDGIHNFRDLIRQKNRDPRRKKTKNSSIHPITVDRFTKKLLNKRGFDLNSIPPKDQIVFLSKRINLGAGAETIDVTEKVHPQIARLAIKVAIIFDAKVLGLDVLTNNISKPPSRKNLVSIIEVNPYPLIEMHHFPYEGKPRNVAGAIWDMVLNDNMPS